MNELTNGGATRRGLLGVLVGAVGLGLTGRDAAAMTPPVPQAPAPPPPLASAPPWAAPQFTPLHAQLRENLGDQIFNAWFRTVKIESNDGAVLTVSTPVRFVRNWVREHYAESLLQAARAAYGERIESVVIGWRKPGRQDTLII